MKHHSIINEIVESISTYKSDLFFKYKGFHPDLYLSILSSIRVKVFILIPDGKFSSLLKYTSSVWHKQGFVFVSGKDNGVCEGFESFGSSLNRRARELLADGVDGVDVIFCSASGKNFPVIGSGVGESLNFTKPLSFNRCLSFLKNEGYDVVDFVEGRGQLAIRGGIIDVFPFSFSYPLRVTFYDSIPEVSRFNLDNQLPGDVLDGVVLRSLSSNKLVPLSKTNLSAFVPVYINDLGDFCIGSSNSPTNSILINLFNYRRFAELKNNNTNIRTSKLLTSMGLVEKDGSLLVPGWFINKPLLSKNSKKSNHSPSLSFSEISIGDYLVHKDHGVGVCSGLYKGDGENSLQEFLIIKYKDGGTISVDIGRLDIIGFVAPASCESVSLDSLSKKSGWLKKRRSAQKSAENVVDKLLSLYIERGGFGRTPYLQDDSLEHTFISEFLFEDTPDQKKAWEEISADLSSGKPMDRLLCGDVGFGKTELAIRAAFRVALSGKRVVVLAPTTILVNQLHSSFNSRLISHSINVDMISRFRKVKDILKIKSDILLDKNDVLIGTHALLYDDIYLKNIGLLVVDEEHRFGVKHKEFIKQFKKNIDVLSMSATPIPRSMNLVFSGIYSVSMLQSPPMMRLPIKTQVSYYSDNIIINAISFELERGGQVYFVHNNINSIENISQKIKSFFLNSSVDFIHGQEGSNIIKNKMSNFVLGKTDILICTSIIESGIDVTSANSIIINNCHLFGLSQLYQMRGRVGRGGVQAYAYLLFPPKITLSSIAFKRIQTIEKNTSLGSGYNVSVSDMENRGSGSLFGYKQSGGSGAIGYEMYTRMIQKALYETNKLKSEYMLMPEDVIIKVFQKRLIPNSYINQESLRISIYKNIASISSNDDIEHIVYNLTSRFGVLPKELNNILKESRLKLCAAKAGVSSIISRSCGFTISIKNRDEKFFATKAINFINCFFNKKNIVFHILPSTNHLLFLCVHIENSEDIYSVFSQFLGKFVNIKSIKK